MSEENVSLELSKELKKLGVEQTSKWYWVNGFDEEHVGWMMYYKNYKPDPKRFELYLGDPIQHDRYGGPKGVVKWYSAFTVQELLDRIPKVIENKDEEADASYLHIFTDECIEWCVAHRGIGYDLYYENSDDPNLANVLAKMLIDLIEKGYVKP